MQAAHCMLCFLGMKHDCTDPEFCKSTDTILRKPFFISNIEDGARFEKLGKVEREAGKYAVITYMVKYAIGTPHLPQHEHPYGEEYLVLEGSFPDQYSDSVAPCYIKYPHNTSHASHPASGSTILTWWGQNNNDDEAVPQRWWSRVKGAGESMSATTV